MDMDRGILSSQQHERMVFMKAFDKIIGYASLKQELMQISDTLKNREFYDKLGVSAPRGLLLYGEPGVGKSLMASAIIEESGRPVFRCRKDEPNGDFVKKIKATFEKAAENAPSIVFLDDMDKFANGDEKHPDAEEYVTVQSCIDETKGKEVFVLATANDTDCLPDSLQRAGRFDRTIEVGLPMGEDAIEIVAYYLKSKRFVEGIDPTVIAKIMIGHSCADLETVINEAGLYAGYERAESITMEHFLKACLRTVFDKDGLANEQDDFSSHLSDPHHIASHMIYHEAGHAVVSEVLCPGSVTLVFAGNLRQEEGGFTRDYREPGSSLLEWRKKRIITSLGGMAAMEQKFGIPDVGCGEDLNFAFYKVWGLISRTCINGFSFYAQGQNDSERLKADVDQAVATQVEQYYRKAKEIISANWDFFEKLAAALAEKKLLSAVDIEKIREGCQVVPVAI